MALSEGGGAVAEVPGGDALRFVGLLPVEGGDTACRLQCDAGTATAGRGILLYFGCASCYYHLHGYRVTAAPLSVRGGGAGGGEAFYRWGEGDGIFPVGQRGGVVVVRQVAARGGEEGEEAYGRRHHQAAEGLPDG